MDQPQKPKLTPTPATTGDAVFRWHVLDGQERIIATVRSRGAAIVCRTYLREQPDPQPNIHIKASRLLPRFKC